MKVVSFEDINNNPEVVSYLKNGDALLGVLGYTEHSITHAAKVAELASCILRKFHYSEREAELAKIAGFMHDIGNFVSRDGHAQTGAIVAFTILTKMQMKPEEIAKVVSAIGNHDEGNGLPISPISAALALADKSDVRRSRVRNQDFTSFDIHDRVNYAVENATLSVDGEKKQVSLALTIDTKISSKMEYFEIFLNRMLMCKRAADFLEAEFSLYMNKTRLL